MSRLEPRSAVSHARPSSAWVLSLVASATLWITGELAPWVIPVQLACFAISYFTRLSPPAWRCNPLWLNVGMCFVTGVTIRQALEGSPAPLSLAYFASLCIGLQLMDARPRKSEFLLVALALFEVVLAANLTDSVFFPPLLAVFLVSATWTLMVHTLRTEAAEAGDAQAASRALTPGLMRNTLIASGLSLVLALVLFAVLPRMRTHAFSGAALGQTPMAGFSDEVSLGTLGRIRQDRTVVLRVETIEGEAPARGDAYWRGLAFDAFDGRSWSVSSQPGRLRRSHLNGSPRFGLNMRGGPQDGALVQRIVREPVEAGVLFAAGDVRRIEGPLDRLQLDINGGIYYPGGANERIRYTLWTRSKQPSDSTLSRDRIALPETSGPRAAELAARFVSLPELDPQVAALAREITAAAANDAARVRALEEGLRQRGRYTDDPPPHGEDGRSPVEDFLLGELAGHCEYFASGMVVLARSLGMPARLVNGFAGGRMNRMGGFTELTRSDAHAWVEIHYADAGWVRYDPTPPDLRLRADGSLSIVERLAEVASAIELWWFQRVVDFDSSDQILAMKSAWGFLKKLQSDDVDAGTGPDQERGKGFRLDADVPWTQLLIGVAGLLAIGLAVQRARAGRRRADAVPRSYTRALRMLARRGLVRGRSETARAFQSEVTTRLPGDAAHSFTRITDAYLAERFGGKPPLHALEPDLQTLRNSLKFLSRELPPDDAHRPSPRLR